MKKLLLLCVIMGSILIGCATFDVWNTGHNTTLICFVLTWLGLVLVAIKEYKS